MLFFPTLWQSERCYLNVQFLKPSLMSLQRAGNYAFCMGSALVIDIQRAAEEKKAFSLIADFSNSCYWVIR